jgi:hypothetical protein
MSHPWGNPQVWIEGYGGGRFVTDAEEVAYFAEVFNQAARLALPPSESVGFIRKLASEWEKR